MRRSQFLKRLLRDLRGATAIEYGLIAALIGIAIMGAVGSVANESNGIWGLVTAKVASVM